MYPCLQSQGMPEPKVEIQAMYRANQNIDVTVAAEDLRAGDTVLRIPEHLIITLKGVFEDEVRPGPALLCCPLGHREGGGGCRGRWPCLIDRLRSEARRMGCRRGSGAGRGWNGGGARGLAEMHGPALYGSETRLF